MRGEGCGWKRRQGFTGLPMWSGDDVVEGVRAALLEREQSLRAEHAVYGLDSLEELELHPILGAGLEAAGFGVFREWPYPHEWRRETKMSRRARSKTLAAQLPDVRDRMRCDLVLTPRVGLRLVDPLAVERDKRRIADEAAGTLFAGAGGADVETGEVIENGVPAEDAYWLEVKVVGQHCYEAGVPGPNRGYGSQLRRTLTDLEKLNADEQIRCGGLLVMLFAADEVTAKHDLFQLAHDCLDRELPVGSPDVRMVEIGERIGNRVAGIGLFGLRR